MSTFLRLWTALHRLKMGLSLNARGQANRGSDGEVELTG
jgi:hypothetical protein